MGFPPALRQAVWLKVHGPTFYKRCTIKWCYNIITPITFQVGHNIPKSKGGSNQLHNLFPICACCNESMGNKFTIDEWQRMGVLLGMNIKP
jgi:5-methylcytosine-specific restriction endonuclease McrA